MKTYRERPFALVGVNSDRDRAATRQVIAAKNLGWRSFWNGGSTAGPISSAWNVSVWPTVYVLDHEGVIRFRSIRGQAVSIEDLDRTIAEQVERAEAAAE